MTDYYADYGFKFFLGECLTHIGILDLAKAGPAPDKKTWSLSLNKEPFRFVVVERKVHECSGGVERAYACRIVGRETIRTDLSWFHELELARAPEPVTPEPVDEPVPPAD